MTPSRRCSRADGRRKRLAPPFSFCSPFGIVSRMSTKPLSYDFANQLLASQDFFERSTRVLEEADSGFRPQEGQMTAAQQVAHVAQTLDWFIEGACRPEGFRSRFRETCQGAWECDLPGRGPPGARSGVRERDPIHPLAQPGEATPGRCRRARSWVVNPCTSMVWSMVEHTAHHRGALTVYSRLLGKVPLMPYGG